MLKRILSVGLLLFTLGCDEITTNNVNPTGPTPEQNKVDVVFLVESNAGPTVVTHTNTLDGTTVLETVPPWISNLKFEGDSVVLLLKAKAVNDSGIVVKYVDVKILVDGKLFREGRAEGFQPEVAISGTWRK